MSAHGSSPDERRIHERALRVLEHPLFFILGTIKSGTTWLQLLLDAHPEICCRGEAHFSGVLAPALEKAIGEYTRIIDSKNRQIFDEIGGYPLMGTAHLRSLLRHAVCLLLGEQLGDSAARVIGEKTPDNIRGLRLLSELFPEARFVHIVRDLRDVAVSGWYHNLRVSPEWTRKTFSSIDDYALRNLPLWVHELTEAERFRARRPQRCFLLRYEDLHADPAAQLGPLLRFLEVECEDAVAASCIDAASFDRLSGGRRRGEENRESHFRRGAVGEHASTLGDGTIAAFREKAGGVMARYGYRI